MSDSTYDLVPFKAPKTSGFLLKAVTHALEGSLVGDSLAGKLLRDVGMDPLRAEICQEALSVVHPLFADCGRSDAPTADRAALPPVELAPEKHALETVADFQRAYREKRLTPTAVAERVLSRSKAEDAADPPLRAVIAQRADEVMAQAEAATARWAAGQPLGPLDGVPVGVKDELNQAGYPTTVGTAFMGQEAASEDAEVVARLRAAGAVLIGKLNMHEIGIGVTGINPHHGAVRNPYDPSRVTGGSSSGSAAAVAAGLCPLSVGADGGGSIRIPAGLCGIVGLKATYGRVSEHGAAPLCWSVAHVGPMGASVYDVALGYALMAGYDPKDPQTVHQPTPNLDGLGDGDLSGIKVGIYRPWFDDADPGVVAACRAGIAALEAAGAEVVEIELPQLGLLRTAHMVTIATEMWNSQRQHFPKHRKDYGLDTRMNLALAKRITGAEYVQGQRLRRRFFDRFQAALERCDVIATPTTSMTAPTISKAALSGGESDLTTLDRIMRYAPAANLTGHPGLSVPTGYDEGGLPVGLQLMGRPWEEALLLRLGLVVEANTASRTPARHGHMLF